MLEKIRLGISCAGVAHSREVETVCNSLLVKPCHFGNESCSTKPAEPCQCTGMPKSWQHAHNGSQKESFIRLSPFFEKAGSASITTPRWPRFTDRSTSATMTSMSLI